MDIKLFDSELKVMNVPPKFSNFGISSKHPFLRCPMEKKHCSSGKFSIF